MNTTFQHIKKMLKFINFFSTFSRKMNSEDQDTIQLKKQNSYTYWVDKERQQVKIDCTPQKVEGEQLQQNQQQAPTNGFSSWNTSGTWEERTIKADDIKKLLENALTTPLNLGADFIVISVDKVEGETTIYLSRGKKRLGFHLKITYDFEGLNGFDGENGSIKYSEFTDDGDREFTINTTTSKAAQVKTELRKHIEKLNEFTLNALNQLKQ